LQQGAPKVKKTAFLSASIIIVLAGQAFAQNGTQPVDPPKPSQPYGGVGVIDLKYVFDNFHRFQQMKAALDKQVQAAEDDVKARKEQIDSLVKVLKDGGYKPGTQDYLAQEDEIRRKSADLKILIDKQKGNFVRQESSIYAQCYEEIKQESTKYAGRYGFGLVLRFNGEGVENPLNPTDVMKELNKPVVIVHPNNDITWHVTKALNDRFSTNPVGRIGVPQNR
jgi:Skp family chaperone for outer membrane proteins